MPGPGRGSHKSCQYLCSVCRRAWFHHIWCGEPFRGQLWLPNNAEAASNKFMLLLTGERTMRGDLHREMKSHRYPQSSSCFLPLHISPSLPASPPTSILGRLREGFHFQAKNKHGGATRDSHPHEEVSTYRQVKHPVFVFFTPFLVLLTFFTSASPAGLTPVQPPSIALSSIVLGLWISFS